MGIADKVRVLMLKGERGEKGETGNFEQLTQEQQNEVAEYVGAKALQASFESLSGTYTTTGTNTSTIEIPINGYAAGDFLFVFVEGLYMVEGVDYTLNGSYITLASPITHSGTKVYFRALHATWGTE